MSHDTPHRPTASTDSDGFVRRLRSAGLVAAVAAVVVLGAIAGGAVGLSSSSAQPKPPQVVYGEVTDADGTAVSGVTVTATYRGEVVATDVTTSSGQYRFDVQASAVNETEQRQFTVGAGEQSTTHEWTSGGAAEIDFTVETVDGESSAPVEDTDPDRPGVTVGFSGGETSVAAITFDNDDVEGSGTVTVNERAGPPEEFGQPPGAPVRVSEITVPDAVADEQATLRFSFPSAALDGAAADDLTVVRYDEADGAWEELETTVVSTGERLVLEATTPGFSTFAVVDSTRPATPTATATPTPTDTPTDGGGDDGGGGAPPDDDDGDTGGGGGAPPGGGGGGGGGGDTATPTATPTATATPTDTPTTEEPTATTTPTPTATATTTATPTTTTTATETSTATGTTTATDTATATATPTGTATPGQPGFGLLVALVALVGAGLLARRRGTDE